MGFVSTSQAGCWQGQLSNWAHSGRGMGSESGVGGAEGRRRASNSGPQGELSRAEVVEGSSSFHPTRAINTKAS